MDNYVKYEEILECVVALEDGFVALLFKILSESKTTNKINLLGKILMVFSVI